MKEKSKPKNSSNISSIKPSGLRDKAFFELVYDIARQIPKGRVTSYGAIAKCMGTGKSARMVGWAMNGCRNIKPKVPAHRVVNSQGLLTGKFHFKTLTQMEELLSREGIKIKNDKVVDFKTKFWDPVEGMDL